MNHFKRIQELVFEYFKDTDNETLIAITDSFSFHKPAKKEGISKLVEKFLKDNDIEDAYVDYVSDYVKGESKLFAKSSMSNRELIENIKNALIIYCYNRFRQMDFPKLSEPDKIKYLGTGDVEKGEICIVDNLRGEYTLCGTMIESACAGETEPTTENVNCKNCLKIVNYCKRMKA